ncbi:MAG: hypothetical protein L6R37_004252 [Teloschistes peruensis]|nr:MAG: hypothetical protein L6R37_004252 [Teloschistes peruensis]
MGQSPAIVFIARHGARLDAADKQWHLTSPTPYDPPLTYGGWVQARTLGNRIASILHARYAQGLHGDSNGISKDGAINLIDGVVNGQPRQLDTKEKRKYKILIHTSPFLRCVQTSIAISAGIAQHEAAVSTLGQPQLTKHHPLHSESQHPVHPSPQLTGSENHTAPHLSAIPEPADVDEGIVDQVEHSDGQVRPQLRIDAFLGEWLSPEYFDLITPPPRSIMMVTSAKAELMRRGEYVDVPAGSYRNSSSKGHFPGGWGGQSRATVDTSKDHDSGPLSTIATIGESLPRPNRANSHDNISTASLNINNRASPKTVSKIETSIGGNRAGYEPPTPTYAISPSDPIPPGYVAHARDACAEVDFQWDSMRQPHDWGDGGDYGEEWSAMHKRFRRGLQSTISWYQHNHTELTTQDVIDGTDNASGPMDDVDDDVDTVLVLVTHGAGCNALIAAVTNQPVLLDVGMASLTMAVRKENPGAQSAQSKQPTRRQSLVEGGVSDEYEVRITASTEHLHARSRSSTIGLQYGTSSHAYNPLSNHRYRTSSVASTNSSSSFNDGDYSKLEAEKGAVASDGVTGGLARRATSSGGLWSKPTPKTAEGSGFGLHKEQIAQSNGHSPLAKEVSSEAKPINGVAGLKDRDRNAEEAHGALGRPTTQRGLWGAPPATTGNERGKGFKRRWTHSEH